MGGLVILGLVLGGIALVAFGGGKKKAGEPGTPSWAKMGDALQKKYLEAIYSSDPFVMLATAAELEKAGFPAEAGALRSHAMMTSGWGEPEPLDAMSEDLRYQVIQSLVQAMLSGQPGLLLQVSDVVRAQGFAQLADGLILYAQNLPAIRANRAARQAPAPPSPLPPSPVTAGYHWGRRW